MKEGRIVFFPIGPYTPLKIIHQTNTRFPCCNLNFFFPVASTNILHNLFIIFILYCLALFAGMQALFNGESLF